MDDHPIAKRWTYETTVANLLVRFLDPEEGRVTLGGNDLRSYRREDVRRTIALAAQDSYLFSASIRDDVLLGRPNASERELEEAVDRAGILEWASALPQGWHTRVGEEGRAVSGGQCQRIAVARALITHAPVLVLDEPTAHLDSTMADRLLRNILTADRDRSVLLITHRPEGIDLVDAVQVLAEGTSCLRVGRHEVQGNRKENDGDAEDRHAHPEHLETRRERCQEQHDR